LTNKHFNYNNIVIVEYKEEIMTEESATILARIESLLEKVNNKMTFLCVGVGICAFVLSAATVALIKIAFFS
jgi:hypothetical protein